MGYRRFPLPGIAVLVGVLVGGCADVAEQAPVVPRIENSRDAHGADPCRLLTDVQLGGIGLAGPGVGKAAAEGPRCEWRGASGTVLGLTLYTNGGGIGMLAQHSEPSTRRVRVAGYPALETFTGRGEFCQYDVGVSDRQVVMASLEAPAPDSCVTLQRMVPLVAANLPPAGSP